MPTYVITDDTSLLNISKNGVVKNIDKDLVTLRIIPANTGLNTTSVDWLSIEHDGEYGTQIPWNDVTVSGNSPSSVENFRTRVLTILNNNGSGGAGDMTAAVYDPAGYASQVTVVDIQRTLNQAQALLASSGAAITAGQGYIIDNRGVTQLPTGISLMRVIGINLPAGVKGFDPNAEAYITALATYVPCTYDVASNAIDCYLYQEGFLTTDGLGGTSMTILNNINMLGVNLVFAEVVDGQYSLTASAALFDADKTFLIFGGLSSLNFPSDATTVSYEFVSSTVLKITTTAFGSVLGGVLNKTYFKLIHKI